MRFYHGKQKHKQNLFLSRITYVIVFVTWRENNSLHDLYVCSVLWTTVKETEFKINRRLLQQKNWKATKEYPNQRGTKIRVFRVFFRAPFPPTLFPSLFPPLPPSGPVHSPATSPLFASPLFHPFLTTGKLRFRYPSDLGTL